MNDYGPDRPPPDADMVSRADEPLRRPEADATDRADTQGPCGPCRLQALGRPVYSSALGRLFEGDCLVLLPRLPSDTFDTIFADPPFNLNKLYGAKTNDNRSEREYLRWCRRWLSECIRLLK